MPKGLEKYFQDAEQHHALEVNYFDDNTRCASEEPNLEDAEQTIQSSKDNQVSPKQTSIEDINIARNALESLKSPLAIFPDSIYQYVQMKMKTINKV